MKTNKILFRMAARCEAAGRPNNEDNYQLDSDLSDNTWGFTADEEISLGDKGSLLVVCDGMGGMSAGEVASDIAVKTIKDWFTTDKLTDTAIANPCKYIASAIVAADAAIKAHSKANPDTAGMGSTIVMAWLLGQKVYVGWCGDSRCYRFNPQLGLERLSHDHSYVQELVDAGKLTEELAFDHPNNNIITRSLGDPRGAAQPDTKEFDLYNQDIILLCSDGLCGTLRDNEIAEIIKANQTSMQECRDALWVADEAAGWTDNVTIGLAQILSGCDNAPQSEAKSSVPPVTTSKAQLVKTNKRLKCLLGVIVVLILLAAIGVTTRKYMPTIKTWLSTPSDTTVVQEDDLEILDKTATDEPVQETPQSAESEVSTIKQDKPIEETPTFGNAAEGKDVEIAIQTQDVITSDNIAGSEETPAQSVVTNKNVEVQTIESNDSIK